MDFPTFLTKVHISSTWQAMVGFVMRQEDMVNMDLIRKVTSSTHDCSKTYMKVVGEDEDGWNLLWIVLEWMDRLGREALLE